jgi:hypothetical protein
LLFEVEALLGEVEGFEVDLDLEKVFEVAKVGVGIVGGLEEADVGEVGGSGEEFGIGGVRVGEYFAGDLGGFADLLATLAFFVAVVKALQGGDAGLEVPAVRSGHGEDAEDGAVGIVFE